MDFPPEPVSVSRKKLTDKGRETGTYTSFSVDPKSQQHSEFTPFNTVPGTRNHPYVSHNQGEKKSLIGVESYWDINDRFGPVDSHVPL